MAEHCSLLKGSYFPRFMILWNKYCKIVHVNEVVEGKKHYSWPWKNSELAQERTGKMNIAGRGHAIKESQRKDVTLFSFVTWHIAHLTLDYSLVAAAFYRIQNKDGWQLAELSILCWRICEEKKTLNCRVSVYFEASEKVMTNNK